MHQSQYDSGLPAALISLVMMANLGLACCNNLESSAETTFLHLTVSYCYRCSCFKWFFQPWSQMRLKRNRPHDLMPVAEFPIKVLYLGTFFFLLHLTGDSSLTTPWIVTHSCGAETSQTSISSALRFWVAIVNTTWAQQIEMILCCYTHLFIP